MSNYRLEKISLEQYHTLSMYQKLIDFPRADEFWMLSIGGKEFGFGIRSSIMIPPSDSYFSEQDVLFVGIYDTVLAFSGNNGDLLLMIGLLDPFTSVDQVPLYYLIITDTTIVKIMRDNLSVTKVFLFPDLIQNYELVVKEIVTKDLVVKEIIVTGMTGDVFRESF